MKTLVLAILLAGGLASAQPARPVAAKTEVSPAQVQQQGTVSRAAIQVVEKSIDGRLSADPFDLLGNTRGIYLPGFGVVLTAEVAAIKLPGPSPFHQTFTADEKAKAHARKIEALPKLRETIKAALISAAADLRSLPLTEKLVFGVNLFYWNWEDAAGLPSQIVMTASRQQLVTKQAAAESIQVQEF